MVKRLKSLQDVLGRFQDSEIQAGMLLAHREAVGAQENGAAALMAMGLLVIASSASRSRLGRVRQVLCCLRSLAPAGARGGDFRVTKVLATYNIKGGVGKTSAAVNLAYLAARENNQVLLWDLDPQGASTFLFRVKPKVKAAGASWCAARARWSR